MFITHMKQWIVVSVLLAISSTVFANDIVIFDVKKSLPMSNTSTTYLDYYINAGTDAGFKEGMVLTVVRRKALYDSYQNTSIGDLKIPVGDLKIIYVQKDVSVARIDNIFSRENLPVLDVEYILVGDQVDVSSVRMTPKKRKKRQTAMKPMPKEPVTSSVPNVINKASFSSKAPEQGPDVSRN